MAVAVAASLALNDAVLPSAVAGYPFVIGGVQLVFGGLVGATAYVATAALTGMEEIGILRQMIRSRLARRTTGGSA
jgi:hypothetical protein